MKKYSLIELGIFVAMAACSSSVHAGEVAAGTFTSKSLGGGEFEYDITLFNNSATDDATTTIGTFWLAWQPGENFLDAVPTNVTSATGWTDNITGPGSGSDGSGIQWIAGSGSLLHAGHSLNGFSFDSTETPAQIAGDSGFHPGTLTLQSTAYSQGPFSDGGDPFIVTSAAAAVPVPTAAWQIMALLTGVFIVRLLPWCQPARNS